LAPNDFWLFPKIESAVKWRFQNIEDIQRNVMTALKTVSEMFLTVAALLE
jgi:hypothetical protein